MRKGIETRNAKRDWEIWKQEASGYFGLIRAAFGLFRDRFGLFRDKNGGVLRFHFLSTGSTTENRLFPDLDSIVPVEIEIR
jgi:hypothetical protein